MARKTIRIGNGAGFWGDNLDAPVALAEASPLDYLTLEYLAELTLSILAHLKARDPAAGYVSDFALILPRLARVLAVQPQLKIVTNAGGMNPIACARAAARILAAQGLDGISIAAVAGDDLAPHLAAHQAAGEMFANLDTGQALSDLGAPLASANAYLGGGGIATALAQGARVVITGRVADASLTVGPAVYEFGWNWTDHKRLAAATVAGHLIECGAQVSGGMFSGWTDALPLADVGYPIAELTDDGGVVITKPARTGGAVTVPTVAEQLIYEIGDPTHYLTPDLDADFSQVQLSQIGADRVAVTGAAGGPAPPRYKVSAAWRDGFLGAATLVLCGDHAEHKARAAADLIFARLRRAGAMPRRTHVECLGTGDTLPGVWPRTGDAREVVLRIAAHDTACETIERFLREFSPLVGSGPPGVTGYTGPRPKPYPVFAYWPSSIARERVVPEVFVHAARDWLAGAPADHASTGVTP